MSDPNVAPAEAGAPAPEGAPQPPADAGGQQSTPHSDVDPDVRKAIERRDSALKRAQAAEARVKELEAANAQAAEAKAKAEGDIASLLDLRDQQIGDLQTQLQAATQEVETSRASLSKQKVMAKLVPNLAEGATGLMVDALISKLESDGVVSFGADTDTDGAAKAILKELQKGAPGVLKSGQGGDAATPGYPGFTAAGKKLSEVPAGKRREVLENQTRQKGGMGGINLDSLFGRSDMG